MKANQALVDLFGRIAEEKNATLAQIAIAWLLAQKPWIVPIPGTTKLRRLEENLGALNVELTGHLAELERAASAITVQGTRYPEWLEATTGHSAGRAGSEPCAVHRVAGTTSCSATRATGRSLRDSPARRPEARKLGCPGKAAQERPPEAVGRERLLERARVN